MNQTPKSTRIISSTVDRAKLSTSRRTSTNEVFGSYFTLAQDETKDVIFQVLKPGQRLSPPHSHSHLVEAVYVLQGRLFVWQAGLEETIEAQSFVGFEPRVPHMLVNKSSQDTEVLVIRFKHSQDRVAYCDRLLDYSDVS